MNYSPILLVTLCRSTHFKRCVDSLSRCTGASQTDLYIGVDYPFKEEHWPGYNEICEYCKTISGFKSVKVFYRPENWGQLKNTRDLRERIQTAGYDSYISTEDDNEFSLNFLEYMNKCLEHYREDPKVLAICSYPHPDKILPRPEEYGHNIYSMRAYCAWGAGNWFKKQAELHEYPTAKEIVFSYRKVFRLFAKKKFTTVHRLLFRFERAAGDIRRSAYCALEDKYCIFPIVPKVRNWGFDGSGHNCAVNHFYERRELDEAATFEPDWIQAGRNKAIDKTYNSYYGGPIHFRVLGVIEYLLFRLTGKTFGDFKYLKKAMAHRAGTLEQ